MPGNPKRVTVTVVLKSDNPLEFDIESDDLPKDEKGNLVFKNNDHPGFQVEFELDDKMNLGYLFPPNALKKDAVWSKLGTSCPTAACDEVLKVTSVRPHRKAVVALNMNADPILGEFRYSLQVAKTNGPPYLSLDPGGVNQNGPTSPRSIALVFVAGGVIGSLLTLGTQALLYS